MSKPNFAPLLDKVKNDSGFNNFIRDTNAMLSVMDKGTAKQLLVTEFKDALDVLDKEVAKLIDTEYDRIQAYEPDQGVQAQMLGLGATNHMGSALKMLINGKFNMIPAVFNETRSKVKGGYHHHYAGDISSYKKPRAKAKRRTYRRRRTRYYSDSDSEDDSPPPRRRRSRSRSRGRMTATKTVRKRSRSRKRSTSRRRSRSRSRSRR